MWGLRGRQNPNGTQVLAAVPREAGGNERWARMDGTWAQTPTLHGTRAEAGLGQGDSE